MFSGVWDAQAAKTGERTMAVSSWACHRGRLDWHMLGQITRAGVDGGLPWESQPFANRNPRKLGQTWALLLPWAPLLQLGRGAPGLRVYKYVNLTLRYWFPEIYIFTAFTTIKFFYHFSITITNMFHLASWHRLLILVIIVGWNVAKKKERKKVIGNTD